MDELVLSNIETPFTMGGFTAEEHLIVVHTNIYFALFFVTFYKARPITKNLFKS